MNDAVAALAAGRVVAAASESFFGLLADTENPAAIDALLRLKSRGVEKGMPVLLPERAAWQRCVTAIPELARRLADAFWPGPLTIALEARPEVDARLLLDGRIGVRLPGRCPAAELARRAGRVLTATSANLPGRAPLSAPAQVAREFSAAVDSGELLIVPELGPAAPAPSTVVVVTADGFRVVREGAIARAEVVRLFGAER